MTVQKYIVSDRQQRRSGMGYGNSFVAGDVVVVDEHWIAHPDQDDEVWAEDSDSIRGGYILMSALDPHEPDSEIDPRDQLLAAIGLKPAERAFKVGDRVRVGYGLNGYGHGIPNRHLPYEGVITSINTNRGIAVVPHPERDYYARIDMLTHVEPAPEPEKRTAWQVQFEVGGTEDDQADINWAVQAAVFGAGLSVRDGKVHVGNFHIYAETEVSDAAAD